MADEELVEGVWGIVSVPVEIEHRAFSGSGPPVRHLRGANNKTHRFFFERAGPLSLSIALSPFRLPFTAATGGRVNEAAKPVTVNQDEDGRQKQTQR